MGEAADVFIKLSVGDGLVTQIPALIVSLAAGLLVSKGGTRGSTDQAVFGQLGAYPRALYVAAVAAVAAGLMPGLPFFPFFALAGGMAGLGYIIPMRHDRARRRSRRGGQGPEEGAPRTRRRRTRSRRR